MATPPSRIRPPVQRRSRDTFERMLGSGVALLREGGWDAVTVGAISRSAGVSIGALYGRFADRAALHAAIQDRVLDTIEADQARVFGRHAWEDLQAREVVALAVRETVGLHQRHEQLLRVLLGRIEPDPEMQRRAAASAAGLAREFTRIVGARADELTHPQPEVAVPFAFRVVTDCLARRVTDAAHGPGRQLGFKRLGDELVTMVTGYLLDA